MFPQEKISKIENEFGEDVILIQSEPQVQFKVTSERLLEFASFLKKEPSLEFDFLLFITATDKKNHFEVVYGVRSMKSKEQLMFKTEVPTHNPEVTSVTSVWDAANWDERETYDLFGIIFKEHPNLKRILLPDNWEGHPLRKNIPLTARPKKVLEQ